MQDEKGRALNGIPFSSEVVKLTTQHEESQHEFGGASVSCVRGMAWRGWRYRGW